MTEYWRRRILSGKGKKNFVSGLFNIAHFLKGNQANETRLRGSSLQLRDSAGVRPVALRLISATRFCGEQVAGHGIGAGTRAAANSAEETASALALQPGTVVQ